MDKMAGRVGLFILVVLIMWGPLYYLSYILGLSESHVLIASLTSILLFFLIFFEEVRAFVDRISSVRIGDFELAFRKAVKESVEEELASVIEISLDERDIHEKAGVDQLARWVSQFLTRPGKKVVMRVQVQEIPTVDLPMLYFQVKLLDEFFNLRAVLFIDGSLPSLASHVLGTISPGPLLRAIDDGNRTLERAYSSAVPASLDSALAPDTQLHSIWQEYSMHLNGYDLDRSLSRMVYRQLIHPNVELNMLTYPLPEREFPKFLGQILSGTKHIVLVREGEFVTVRTVDKLAREIAAAAIEMVISGQSAVGE